jgi:glycine betaine/proline transport system substrate-binding protein
MTRPIRVGHIDLSFHDAPAREVDRILRARGHRIERSATPHGEMFRRMGEGEVDVLVSAWLPSKPRRPSSSVRGGRAQGHRA